MVQSKIPIGRLGKPEEIASIVLMLVTNGYMTNKVRSACHTIQRLRSSLEKLVLLTQIIVADGGWTNGGL